MQSDMTIPRTSEIIDRSLDARQIAARQDDAATVRQIDRLITKLPEARLCWQLGTLIIDSPSGATYHITRAGCDCENGRKSHARACWHWTTFNLLLDMFETECETNDMEADARPVAARIVAARRVCWVQL